MKYFRHLLGVLWLIAFAGCDWQTDIKHSQIIGLASPITLQPNETEVVLEDYFIDASLVSEVILPKGMEASPIQDGKVYLHGSITEPLDVLVISAGGLDYSILLKRTEKETVEFIYDPKGKTYTSVKVKGEMNSWDPNNTVLEKEGDVWKVTATVNRGIFQYIYVVDGVETLDPDNSEKVSNGMGGWNNVLRVGSDLDQDKIWLNTKEVHNSEVTFTAKDAEKVIVIWQNHALQVVQSGDEYRVMIPPVAQTLKRTYIRAWAFNESGSVSNDVLIPLENGIVIGDTEMLTRQDFETWNMYFVLIDRFVDGNPANTRKVEDDSLNWKVNYFGGDFAGITKKIKDGYFNQIGINTIWLSPITRNPETAYGLWDQGGPVTKFSGYHGYWPISSTRLDDRFGTEEEFRELLDVAHENDMNVILDYVANHVHEEHPVFQQHPEWATNKYLPDGTPNIALWDEQRLTTWFDTFMPSLDYSNPEVLEMFTDSALYWVKEYELDGIRHDATKHIPLPFWRTLTRKIKEEVTIPTGRRIYQVGETYGSRELIASYINTGMLDAQFDFGIYNATLNTFGRDESFTGLRDQLNESFKYYGYHNLMGNISGNHDQPRFITMTSGEVRWDEDPKIAGWTREIGFPEGFAYDKLNLLHAFNLTIPGIPVTYYGDEFGMPGAHDPDNRRWMRFDDELNTHEQRNRNTFTKLATLRNSSMPLLYGDFIFHKTEDDVLVYSRAYFSQQVIVILNKSGRNQQISVELRDGFDYSSAVAEFNGNFMIRGNELSIKLPANSFEIIKL
ncbi:MAG TPA: alpha-amlyase [Balneolaceae bacterium]|nr:alpha-amlyase [Balneolaceae bacterium]|tara:strand:- start:131810 stop:134170 length:2361 start_codon:yes stop_codon:yes gene_type:complete